MAVQDDFGVGAIGATIGAAITGLFAWLSQRGKIDSDKETAALAEWSKLYEAVSAERAKVEEECAQLRRQHSERMAELRKAHATEIEQIMRDHGEAMAALRTNHNDEIRERDRAFSEAEQKWRELNEGLQRMIAQQTQSAAALLGDSPVTKPKDDGDAPG